MFVLCMYTECSLSLFHRSVFLRMVSLGVLLFTLWSQITCFDGVLEACALCHYNYKSYPVSMLLGSCIHSVNSSFHFAASCMT